MSEALLASTLDDRYDGNRYTIPSHPRAMPTLEYRDSHPTGAYGDVSSTIYDRFPKRHDATSSRFRATSTADHHGSRPMGSYRNFPIENTTVGRRDLEARRGRGRSKSRSPIRDSHRPRREASWDHEWTHDRYNYRDAGLSHHGETSGSQFSRSQTKQKLLPYNRADTKSYPQSKSQNARQGSGPSTHVPDDRMSRRQDPIMLVERKPKTNTGPLFSDESYTQENFAAQKLLVDTDKKVQLTGLGIKRQSAGEARYSLRARGQNVNTNTALFKSVEQARLIDAGSESQTGREPVCGIDSHCQDGSATYEITARPTENPEAAVSRLQRVMTNMHADMTKLKRRDNLFALINHRRKLWLNEIDLHIGLEEGIVRDAVALQLTMRSDKLIQQKTISHSQQCLNITNDIRTRMERTIIETIRMVIEMPKLDFLADTASEEIMNTLDRQKGQMVRDMEQRVGTKKRAFQVEMQAFTDQERGKRAREMQEREVKKGGGLQDGHGSFLSQRLY